MVKAKSVKDNCWIEGFLWKDDKFPLPTSYVVDSKGEKVMVYADTICECLNIKDRFNRYIYEGDIIQLSQRGPKQAFVEYDKEFFRWRLNYNLPANSAKPFRYKPCLQASRAHLYEVIGNLKQ